MLCIKNGRIHDAVHREPYTADILIENGKLLQIGTDLHAEQTIDAAGLEIYPGFVDAHSHIGLDGYGEPGVDINERNDICCPQLRAIDGVNPMDESFVYARSAGITCVCTGPGSANVLGGTFAAHIADVVVGIIGFEAADAQLAGDGVKLRAKRGVGGQGNGGAAAGGRQSIKSRRQ